MMVSMEDYMNGSLVVGKEEEKKFLQYHVCKNTGKLAEKYVENLLKNSSIAFIKNPRIRAQDSIVIPDFYLQELDTVLEIKSRSYNCPGTASEKIDNIPRKYSKIRETEEYKNTKIIVVFTCYEILNPSSQELVNPIRKYAVDFVNLAKFHGVSSWITLPNLIDTLKKLPHSPISLQESMEKVKPFVKWVGGKTKISKKILEHFPSNFQNYFEPFAGGAAIGFKLCRDIPKNFSDINRRLINCYNTVKNDVESLITELHRPCYVNTLEHYNALRTAFNEEKSSDLQQAAQFIYLNKCCFNGIYRENKSGKFNVPFGKMKNPVICDDVLLRNVSKFLQNVNISHGNYDIICAKEGDCVYLDPPYFQTFSEYSSGGFSKDDHIKLKEFVDRLTADGVLVMLSNSYTDFIKELYSDYTQITIDTRYSVSGKDSGRTDVQEILIKNF